MEQMVTCKEALSNARDLAKHTIVNIYAEMDDEDIMTLSEASIVYKSVMTIIEVNKILSDRDAIS